MDIQKRETIAFDHSGLKDLLRMFLNDPYVQEQQLSKLTLEELGKFIEDELEENETARDSIERIKSHYCLILLELELLSYTSVPEESVYDFHQKLFGAEELPLETPENIPSKPYNETEITITDLVLPGGARFETTNYDQFEIPNKNFRSQTARTYYDLSHTLTFAGSFPRSIQSQDLNRLHVQCQIWTLECELLARIKPALDAFWPQRDTHVSRVIYQNVHAFDFHPSIREGFEQFAKDHPDWLYEGKFPVAGFMASLRYLLSVPTVEKFIPASIDFGALLLLFGRNAEYKAQLIYNVLGIQGISPDEILEMAARLSRIQRLKAKVLNPHQTLSTEVLELAASDFGILLPMVLRLEAHPKNSAKETAAKRVA